MTNEQATPDKVRQAASLLSSLPVNSRKGRRGELRDMVEALRPELEEAHTVKKYTWEELCEYLKEAGIDISVHTLKTYMRKPKEQTQEALPASPPQSAASQDDEDSSTSADVSFPMHLPQSKRSTKDQFTIR